MSIFRKALLASLAVIVISLCSVQTSYADTVIFDNGAPNGVSGRLIGRASYVAEDFTFASAQTIVSIRFWGAREVAMPGAFTGQIYWEIRANAGAMPGAVLTSGVSPATETFRTLIGTPGFGSYQYDFSIGSVDLAAGTYWLVLHDGIFPAENGNLLWETTDPNTTFLAHQRTGPVGGFTITTPPATHLAFQINGPDGAVVPEPATMLLLGAGLAGVAGAVRRRRKSRQSEEA